MNILLSRPVKAGGVNARRNRNENDIMKPNLKNILGMAALGMTLLATTVPTWAGNVRTSRGLHTEKPSLCWRKGKHGQRALQCGQQAIHRVFHKR